MKKATKKARLERERRVAEFDQKRVEEFIASVGNPPGTCFLVGTGGNYLVSSWSVNGAMNWMIDDDVFAEAVTQYLLSRGLVFEDYKEAEKYARTNGWPTKAAST